MVFKTFRLLLSFHWVPAWLLRPCGVKPLNISLLSLRRVKLAFASQFPLSAPKHVGVFCFFFCPSSMSELRWWNPVVLLNTISACTDGFHCLCPNGWWRYLQLLSCSEGMVSSEIAAWRPRERPSLPLEAVGHRGGCSVKRWCQARCVRRSFHIAWKSFITC